MKSVLFSGLRVAGSLLLLVCLAAAPGRLPVARAAPASAPAAFTVNTGIDAVADFTGDPLFDTCRTNVSNSTCSLRAAVMNANRHAGGATIILPAGLYVLTLAPAGTDSDANGDLTISNTVTIVGAGAAGTIVDGGLLDRVFFIEPNGTLTMTGVTIRNGSVFIGGGVLNRGQLSLANSIISGNHANTGGGLVNDTGHTATLTNDTLQDNQALFGGGLANNGVLALNDSTLAYNRASQGGGLFNAPQGALTVFNSTISNNSASGQGGGVKNLGNARFFHTTIAGNLADDGGVAASDGGGLFNSATAPTGTVQLWNSLLQFNFAAFNRDDCEGQPVTSKDYNFFDATCPLTGTLTHDVFALDSHLGSLADNGGPTLTRALYAGSPAIDKIPPGLCRDPIGNAPVPDQRGVLRPVGPQCDMGAYEGSLPSPLLGRNLVANGDAEGSPGAVSGAHVGAAGWPATQGEFTVVPYNAPGGFPSVPTDTVPANHGLNFFAGGNVSFSFGQQIISLVAISPTVDAGGVPFLLSGDLGGFLDQADSAVVDMAFEDSALTILGPIHVLGPVTAAQRGNQTGLLPMRLAGQVPPLARRVVVTVQMTRAFGSYNDGYADNISLVLLPPLLFLPLARR